MPPEPTQKEPNQDELQLLNGTDPNVNTNEDDDEDYGEEDEDEKVRKIC